MDKAAGLGLIYYSCVAKGKKPLSRRRNGITTPRKLFAFERSLDSTNPSPTEDARRRSPGVLRFPPNLPVGSTFVVRLPIVLPLAGEGSSDEAREGTRPTVRRRILVVDDNRDAASSLATMLNLMGNDTHIAGDGLEAVTAAAACKPDVILLDIGMPKLNGYDACRRIREEPWGKNIIIVACTGWGLEEDKRKSREAGFDFHLVKPVDPATLAKLLAGLLVPTG